jgi:hypothetical protein
MVDIYDMEGVRWGQMSSGMRLLSGVLSVAQDHYPENLSQAFVVNVPGFFASTWRLISAAIDKRTQKKIVIFKDAGTEALDAVLGTSQGSEVRGGRDSVWQIGDEWLGGGSEEVVQLSATNGWVHEQTVEVAPDGGRGGDGTDGQARRPNAGRRLMWCFRLEGKWRPPQGNNCCHAHKMHRSQLVGLGAHCTWSMCLIFCPTFCCTLHAPVLHCITSVNV